MTARDAEPDAPIASRIPKGIIAVLIAPDGRVLVSVSDFDKSGYGGFTLRQAQSMRARSELAREAMRAFCHPDFADSIDQYRAEEIIRSLCDKKKYRVEILPVGHEGKDDDE